MRLYMDYSQVELRVLAYYTRDPVLLDTFWRGQDAHDRTSMEMFGTTEKAKRGISKRINFGLSYGLSEGGLARQAGCSVEQAAAFFKLFFERYQLVDPWRQRLYSEARSRTPPHATSVFGRVRRIPYLNSPDKGLRRRGERQLVATIIQGTAAQFMKRSMVDIYKLKKQMGSRMKMCSTIHDDLQSDVPREEVAELLPHMVRIMETQPHVYPVPIKVDVEWSDTNWSEKKKPPKGTVQHVYTPPAAA
jgi:DNA polymerase-1